MTGLPRESHRRTAAGVRVFFPVALCCALLVRCEIGCTGGDGGGGEGGEAVLPTVVVNRIGLSRIEVDPRDLLLEQLVPKQAYAPRETVMTGAGHPARA